MNGFMLFLRLFFTCILLFVSAYGGYGLRINSDFLTSTQCHRFLIVILAVVISSGLLGLNILGSSLCLGSCCSAIFGIILIICYFMTNIYFIITLIRLDNCCYNFVKNELSKIYIFSIINLIYFSVFILTLFIIIIIKCRRNRKVGTYGDYYYGSNIQLV